MLAQITVLFLLASSVLSATEKTNQKKQTAEKRSDNGQPQKKRGLYGIDPVDIYNAPPLPSFTALSPSTPLPLELSSFGPFKPTPHPEVIITPSSTPHYGDIHSSSLPPISSTPLPPHGAFHPHAQIKEITITKEVPIPYYVHVEKKVPYPVYIQVPHPYPVTVEKHVPYEVRVPVERPVPVPVPKPYPVPVEKRVPYPVKVPVDRPYPVHVPVEKPVPYPVEKPVPYPVQVLVDRPVEVPKPYPVPVEKRVPYPVKVPVPVDRPVPVPYEKHYGYHDEPVKPAPYHHNRYGWPSLFNRYHY